MTRKFGLLIALGLGALACEQEAPKPNVPIFIDIVDDQGRALPGAELALGGRKYESDPSGRVALSEPVGDNVKYAIELGCPVDHHVKGPLPTIEVRALFDLEKPGALQPLEYRLVCERDHRQVVIGVAAVAGLPVVVQGKALGVIPEAGVFHTMINVKPETEIEVGLDTTQFPNLRPQHPSRVFKIVNDDLLVVDQAFQVQFPRPKKPVAKLGAPKRHVPQRL